MSKRHILQLICVVAVWIVSFSTWMSGNVLIMGSELQNISSDAWSTRLTFLGLKFPNWLPVNAATLLFALILIDSKMTKITNLGLISKILVLYGIAHSAMNLLVVLGGLETSAIGTLSLNPGHVLVTLAAFIILAMYQFENKWVAKAKKT